MPQVVGCGKCGKKFKVGDDKAGKRLQCGCGAVITIPAAAEERAPWDEPAHEVL